MRTLLFSAVVALAAIGCTDKTTDKPTAEAKREVPEISIAEVAAGLEAKQLTVIDCNSQETRKKVGVLPGAVLVDDETFTASALPSDKGAKLVFYCGGLG